MGYVFEQATREDFFGERKSIFRLSQFKQNNRIFVTPPITWEFRIRDYFKRVYFLKGAVMNAANDFSSPGAPQLFEEGKWQKRMSPFVLHIALVSVTPKTREQEAKNFAEFLGKHLTDFKTRICLALNIFNCAGRTNGKKRMLGDFEQEIEALLNCFETLQIPVLINADVLFSFVVGKAVSKHPVCDGFIISNPIPWDMFPDHQKSRRDNTIAGKPLIPLAKKWLQNASEIRKPIIVGGCLCREDIKSMFDLGASAVLLDDAVSRLRPWRIRSLISYANTYGPFREKMAGRRIVARLTRTPAMKTH